LAGGFGGFGLVTIVFLIHYHYQYAGDMMSHFDLMSLRKCAEQLGVSHAYLSKLKKEGYFCGHPIPGKAREGYRVDEIRDAMPERILSSDKPCDGADLFDDSVIPESSVADLSPEEKAERNRIMMEAAEAKRFVEESMNQSCDLGMGDDDEDIEAMDLVEARKKKEYWLGKQAELKYRKESGEYVEKDVVEREAFGMARLLRDKLMNIGDRVSPIVAAQSDRFVCKQIIDDEVNRALNDVIGGIE